METEIRVSVEDDGDLPQNTLSPYRYFVSGKDFLTREKSPRFCNELELPPMWEIREIWSYGEIHDARRKRAILRFFDPWDEHYIKTVEWIDENGKKCRVDHYDCFGCRYFSDYYRNEEIFESRTYFTEDGREVVTYQPSRDTVTLLENGETRMFPNQQAFLDFFYEKAEQDGIRLAGK